MTRRRILGLACAGLVLVAASAGAQGAPRVQEGRGGYTLRLEDAAGLSLPSYFHEGRWFVLGEKGERYTIVIDNPTGERVEAVVSVDGRDAITGRVASYRHARGYIVPAYGSVAVEGFRRSLTEVASFRFVDPAASYSARLGTPENVGVVGVAFFRERVRARIRARAFRENSRWMNHEEPESRAKGQASPASRSPTVRETPDDARGAARDVGESVSQRLGTEYGERRQSSVTEVPFERRSRMPESVMTLKYDSARGLVARGIDLDGSGALPVEREPQAFPNGRFAEPPE